MSPMDLGKISSIDITKLTEEKKQIYTLAKDLMLKSSMNGGLVFQDEFALKNAIKELTKEETADEVATNISQMAQTDADVNDIAEFTRKAIAAMVEELKKLPTDVRPLDEEFGENPRYAKYLAKNPPQYTVKVNRPPRKK